MPTVDIIRACVHQARNLLVRTRLRDSLEAINIIIPHAKIEMGSRTSRSMNMIIPGLYLSDCDAASDWNRLQKYQVLSVIDLSGEKYWKNVQKVRYLNILIEDVPESNILQYFRITNRFIESGLKRGSVLIHCLMGVSRSATIVIAFIMHRYHWRLAQALEYVRHKRPAVNPNKGFLEQLKCYEKYLFPDSN